MGGVDRAYVTRVESFDPKVDVREWHGKFMVSELVELHRLGELEIHAIREHELARLGADLLPKIVKDIPGCFVRRQVPELHYVQYDVEIHVMSREKFITMVRLIELQRSEVIGMQCEVMNMARELAEERRLREMEAFESWDDWC